MRGRKPGQGKFTGGRPKTSPNKKGKFETSLPPVRCSEALKAYYEDNARAAGMDLSTYLREVLTSIKSNGEQGEEIMKKNMTAIALAYNSYANWIKIDSANAEQREHENHPIHRIWCGQDNISPESKLYAARPDDAEEISDDIDVDVEPGDQILINPFDMRGGGEGRIVEKAWAGYLVAEDGSLIELNRGVAGVMPLE